MKVLEPFIEHTSSLHQELLVLLMHQQLLTLSNILSLVVVAEAELIEAVVAALVL